MQINKYHHAKMYKLTNDIDDSIFYGATTMNLPARLSSLKMEMSNIKNTSEMLEHMRKYGKEHFLLN